MADTLVLLEEQRTAIRDAERELVEASTAKAEWERKVSYLQWHLERLKRLYALTSHAAPNAGTGQVQTQLPIPPSPEKSANGRPGTVKQAIIDVLREQHRQMTAREIWGMLENLGVKINSDRPVEVVASTMRASIARNQNIFTRDGSKFGQ